MMRNFIRTWHEIVRILEEEQLRKGVTPRYGGIVGRTRPGMSRRKRTSDWLTISQLLECASLLMEDGPGPPLIRLPY